MVSVRVKSPVPVILPVTSRPALASKLPFTSKVPSEATVHLSAPFVES